MSRETTDVCDEALLAQCVQGNEGALAILYDRYAGTIYAAALRALDDPRGAEAVVHAVFKQVWQTARRFPLCHASCAVWIFSIAQQQICATTGQQRRAAPPTITRNAMQAAMFSLFSQIKRLL